MSGSFERGDADARRSRARAALAVAVPVCLAVLTWLVALLAVGVVASVGVPSLLDLVALFVVGITFWPIYRVAPWRPGMTGRVVEWLRNNRTTIGIAVALLVARSLPFAPGLVVGLLDLPFRSASILFGASVFYRQQVGPEVGHVLLKFGQWYLEIYWLLVIGYFLTPIGRRLGRAFGTAEEGSRMGTREERR